MKTRLICSAVIGVFALPPTYADVTVHRITTFSGIAGMGASEMSSTEHIQGLKKREESSHRFTGSILSRFTNESSDASIFRIDKNVIWQLDPQAKRYTERPLDQLGAALEESKAQQESRPEAKSDAPAEESDMKITRNEVTVKKTGKSDTINGYPCDEYVVEWIVEATDQTNGAKVLNTMTSVMWTAEEKGDLSKLREEEMKYTLALAEKLNVALTPEDQQKFGLQALGGLVGSMDTEQFTKEMSKVEGYPIVVDVTWRAQGDDPSQQDQSASSGSTSATPDLTSIAKEVGGLFGGLMGKPKSEPAPAKASGASDQGGVIFQSRSEVTKVEVTSLDDGIFEVPESFQKR